MTIAPRFIAGKEGGGIRHSVPWQKRTQMNENPCGVGDAATDVERVASAARGRSHTLNVYT